VEEKLYVTFDKNEAVAFKAIWEQVSERDAARRRRLWREINSPK